MIRRMMPFLVVAFVIAMTPSLFGQAQRAPGREGISFDQRLDEQIPLELTFNDESGKPVKLAECFRGKPVVLVPYYARCPMLCGLILRAITKGMSDVQFNIGEDYDVLAVSFDPKESPEVAAATKSTYVAMYNRPGAAEGWHFLTGNEENIKKLMDTIGFRYIYDPKTDMYRHAAGIVVVTPTGKISRYLLGVDYNPRDLRLALVEASANKVGSPTDQVLLYCFHYDPDAGKYTANVMAFIRTGGALTMLVVVGMVWIMVRKRKARSKTTSPLNP